MKKLNPYRPGAGLIPKYLAGRDTIIDEMNYTFDALCEDIPIRSIIYSGVRGVGKTVLLNTLMDNAETRGIYSEYIEMNDNDNFISKLVTISKKYLRKISVVERLSDYRNKALDALKALSLSFDPTNQTYSLSMSERELYTLNDISEGLTDVFVSLGTIAKKNQTPICYFIDEMQSIKKEELSGLITAIHRSNQLGLPIMIVGAGLPKIISVLSAVKSYSERLFQYETIENLPRQEAVKAITEPAKKYNVSYEPDVIERIIDETEGYPYFIQQLCQILYDSANNDVISKNDLDEVIEKYYDTLDKGFYLARYERCSQKQKDFLFAMTMCYNGSCNISSIAKTLNKQTSEISTFRAQLISKGIIYPIRYSELDFTVPKFNDFIKRRSDYTEWQNNQTPQAYNPA